MEKLFNSSLNAWDITEKNGVVTMEYKDKDVVKNNLPEDISAKAYQNVSKYIKSVKQAGFEAAVKAQEEYLAKNKGVTEVIAKVPSGLNTSDHLAIKVTKGKEVRVPGLNGKEATTKKIVAVKLWDKTHSTNMSKTVIKNASAELTMKLLG